MAKRGIIAFVLVVIVWMILDMIIHRAILGGLYAQTANLWRPPDQMKYAVSFVVTLIFAATFVAVYAKFFAKKNLGTGLGYGLLFGIGAGVTMGHGSFAVMPIPYGLALGWFLGRVAEGLIAGAILGLVIKQQR